MRLLSVYDKEAVLQEHRNKLSSSDRFYKDNPFTAWFFYHSPQFLPQKI